MEVTNKQPLIDDQGEQITDYFTMGAHTNVITDGPLARSFSAALDQLYAREYDPITGVAMETQAIDEIEAKRNWLAAKVRSLKFANDGTDVGFVYGVKEAQADHDNMIDVVDTISEMTDVQKSASAIVLDGGVTTPTSGDEEMENPVSVAIEQYAKSRGVAVYHSFNEFIKRHGV